MHRLGHKSTLDCYNLALAGLRSLGSKSKQSNHGHRKENMCLHNIHQLYKPLPMAENISDTHIP